MEEKATYKASIKVMKSYNYCHFEVNLGSDKELTPSEVDKMMNEAQRLTDFQIEKYIKAKNMASLKIGLNNEKDKLLREIEIIKNRPQSEWTAEDKAKVKAIEDKEHFDRYNYDYGDDYNY